MSDGFRFFADIAMKLAGITLDDSKLYLVETRLSKLCKEFECADINELYLKVRNNVDEVFIKRIIESMTTNETWWFRDQQMFDALTNNIWPALIKKAKASGRSQIDMWCAACSTGQEPYSLKIVWEESGLGNAGIKLNIVATDIDTKVLDQSKAGEYSQLEVGRGMPIQLLIKYFDQEEARWKLKDNVKQGINWQQFNLMEGRIAPGVFDIVLCRNVLIYFTPEGKETVLNTISRSLHPHGMLFVGGSESLIGLECELNRTAIDKAFAYAKPAVEALLAG